MHGMCKNANLVGSFEQIRERKKKRKEKKELTFKHQIGRAIFFLFPMFHFSYPLGFVFGKVWFGLVLVSFLKLTFFFFLLTHIQDSKLNPSPCSWFVVSCCASGSLCCSSFDLFSHLHRP